MGKDKNNVGAGFTLVEILIVVSVIGILAAITGNTLIPNWHERTYFSRSIAELNTLGNATNLYVSKYNVYPPDQGRGIPAPIMEFVQSAGRNAAWPVAPWPGSTYEWDNWPPDASKGFDQTYQLSIHFCNAGDTATCKRNFPREKWVTSSWDSYSSVYYCISGTCRADQNYPVTHAGYCINCGTATDVFRG